jgi:hypothetical protein
MIAEDLLERGLAEAANEYDVPAGAVDRIRDELAPNVEAEDSFWRWSRPSHVSSRSWLILSAACLVVIIVVAFAIGGAAHQPNVIKESASGGGAATGSRDSLSSQHADAARLPVSAQVPAPEFAPGSGTSSGSGSAGVATSSGPTVASGGGAVSGPVEPVPTVPDRIVKTGELDLQVPKGQVTATLDKLTALATLVSGYVADSSTSEGGIAPSGQVTLRVPVSRFDDTITRARGITGVKVLSLETSAKDVTSKYVDLQARLKALQDTRNVFLTLLSKARTIGETLAVQQHVTDVQSQIEQLQGQIKVLASQSALSTLTVTVDQKVTPVAAPKHHEKSGLHKAIDRSVSRFVRGVEAIIGVIGPLLLAALLIALFWIVGKFGYRVLRRRMV